MLALSSSIATAARDESNCFIDFAAVLFIYDQF